MVSMSKKITNCAWIFFLQNKKKKTFILRNVNSFLFIPALCHCSCARERLGWNYYAGIVCFILHLLPCWKAFIYIYTHIYIYATYIAVRRRLKQQFRIQDMKQVLKWWNEEWHQIVRRSFIEMLYIYIYIYSKYIQHCIYFIQRLYIHYFFENRIELNLNRKYELFKSGHNPLFFWDGTIALPEKVRVYERMIKNKTQK